jgi:hypothetical protein
MNSKVVNIIAMILVAMPVTAAEAVPKPVLEGLAAEDFAVREKSQLNLLEWAKQNPKERTGSLVALSSAKDPEIRMRSVVVMRQLSDEDYLSDGQGYLGISMLEQNLNPGAGIRVLNVMKGSPAHESGIKTGDLIIALDGKPWDKEGAVNVFMETIAQKKPLVDVILKIRRDNAEPIEITVKLGRRPVADLTEARGNLQLLDKKAKDEHFMEWLNRHKSGQE